MAAQPIAGTGTADASSTVLGNLRPNRIRGAGEADASSTAAANLRPSRIRGAGVANAQARPLNMPGTVPTIVGDDRIFVGGFQP